MAVSNLTIDKRSPYSIQRQLATQLLHLIRSGSVKPGEQLPTVRQLAGYLRINHNTVALAYRDLEAQGLLRVEQGRGTFVTEAGSAAVEAHHGPVAGIVREAYERCAALGATPVEFLDAATAIAQLAEAADRPPHILLVECNPSETDQMQGALAPELGARLSTATLEELPARVAAIRQGMADVDLIVTTFFHVNEVETHAEGTGVKVAGLYMGPSIRTLVRIMALGPEARIGAIGATPVCVRGLTASLQNVLGTDRPLAVGNASEPDTVRAAIGSADVVVYGEAAQPAVEPVLLPHQERIVVENQIDRGSIEMLKELVADLARRKAVVTAGGAA